MTTFEKLIIIGLATVGILAVLAVSLVMVGRRKLHGRAIKPGPRLQREIDIALTDPRYAPGSARLARRTAAPLHTDYAARLQQHQPCDIYPCPHYAPEPTPRGTVHCRCGNDWVCDLAGPLNANPDAPIPNQRNRQDREGRWPL